MRGTYCLVIKLDRSSKIPVGKLGTFDFPKGYYVYIGSAMNGFESRVGRHIKPSSEKKKHWHIDYLLDKSKVVDVVLIPSDDKRECEIAKKVGRHGKVTAPGFGSSDCNCDTHLFHFDKSPMVEEMLLCE